MQSHGKALEKECCLLGIFCDILCYYYYFASAAVAVDSSHMTASSSAWWSRFSPPSNFVSGRVSNNVIHDLLLATITGRWLGETPFVQVSTTWALTCPVTVHQRRDHVRLNRENGPRTTIITYACCKFLGYATGTDRRTDRMTTVWSLDRRMCVQLEDRINIILKYFSLEMPYTAGRLCQVYRWSWQKWHFPCIYG